MQIFQVNVEAQAGRASVAVNGETVDIPGGYGNGLNVVVISRTDPRSRQAYRFAIVSADEFAQLIEDLPPERALRACAMLGSGLAANRTPGAAWAMIGQRGTAPGGAVERLSGSAASASADVPVVAPADGEVRIMARGSADSAAITIQDIALTLPEQAAGPGLYAVTIDETTCQVLGKQFFTAAPRDMEQFAAFAAALPPGRLVAVAAWDDLADLHLPGNAITAAAQLGSGVVKIGQAGYWAIVGVKGALPGSVAEAWSWKRAASCTYWRLPDRPNAVAGFPLAIRADFGSVPVITMGGIDVTTLPGGARGLPSRSHGCGSGAAAGTGYAPRARARTGSCRLLTGPSPPWSSCSSSSRTLPSRRATGFWDAALRVSCRP